MTARGHETPAELARRIVAATGPCSLLLIGARDAGLLVELLARGCDAHCLLGAPADAEAFRAVAPERICTARLQDLAPGSFHTVVVAGSLDEAQEDAVAATLRACWTAAARFVFVEAATAARNRAWWEERCLRAGFRKHPCYYGIHPYASLEQEPTRVLVPLEKIPAGALAAFPLAALQADRQLHMDMLREVGRRGDAHCHRYHAAAEYVRPGDSVLDLACGYGYGSHILYQNCQAKSVQGIDLDADAIRYANANYALEGAVSFAVGNAQDLSGIADHSVDFIASFETIEHLPDPDAYLDELRRVLRPAGRVMICAPNDWADETGKDPNPHHLHVYTWERLRREVGARFLLEKGFVQTAGGAVKCHHSPRAFAEVPLAELDREAEWILLLGMADPCGAADVPYRETAFPLPADPGFHVSAFARDYDNPWLVRGMVTIGSRIANPEVLAALRRRVLQAAAPDSADHGAALCGEVHAAIAAPLHTAASHERLLAAVRTYAGLDASDPHRLRWQISLLSAGAELALRRGDRRTARAMFEDCARRDALAYSPLLGNRTLDALFRLACMHVVDRDLDRARQLLQRSVAEARRLASGPWLNVYGDPDRPLAFGLAELSQLIDKAARSAYALAVLDTALQRPALFAFQARGWFERVLEFRNDDLRQARIGERALAVEVGRLTERLDELVRLLATKEARIHELGAEVVAQDAHAQRLAAQVRELSGDPRSKLSRFVRWLGGKMRGGA